MTTWVQNIVRQEKSELKQYAFTIWFKTLCAKTKTGHRFPSEDAEVVRDTESHGDDNLMKRQSQINLDSQSKYNETFKLPVCIEASHT